MKFMNGFTLVDTILAVILISAAIDISLRTYKVYRFSEIDTRHENVINYIELLSQKIIRLSPTDILSLHGNLGPFSGIDRPDAVQNVSLSVKPAKNIVLLDYNAVTVTVRIKNRANPLIVTLYKEAPPP